MRGLAVLCVVSAALLVSCTTPTEPAAPFEPRVLRPDGEYRHAYTELAFPERSGPFRRLYVKEYDPDRANVSGHYAVPMIAPGAATIYHYPATFDASPPSREEFIAHFERAKAEVLRVYPGAMLVWSGGIEQEINGFRLSGAHARYTLHGRSISSGTIDSHLYLFALGGWYLKFRFSHPYELSADLIPQERQFMSSTSWPIPD